VVDVVTNFNLRGKAVVLHLTPGIPGRTKNKTALVRRVREATGGSIAMICRTLGIGRATAYRKAQARPRRYHCRQDEVVLTQLKQMLRERGSYGYRRARRIVNRAFGTGYNRKRIQRVSASLR
jgi:hypothetical protein